MGRYPSIQNWHQTGTVGIVPVEGGLGPSLPLVCQIGLTNPEALVLDLQTCSYMQVALDSARVYADDGCKKKCIEAFILKEEKAGEAAAVGAEGRRHLACKVVAAASSKGSA